MMLDREASEAEDPRVIRASREYLQELESGRKPDREHFFQRDPDLRETLSELFDGIELAQVLRPRTPPALTTEPAGEPLGDFRIVREIGRGGMGVVYEAVQLSLGRRVALKVLPFSAALDSRHRQRFQNEAQAAALLHHTNIVPVYAVGCERGLHFYAMQLIEGRSLAEVIGEWKGADNPTQDRPHGMVSTLRNALDSTQPPLPSVRGQRGSRTPRDAFRDMAELAAKVADALQYAHEAGVIHRDIKPANLMLDLRGGIWVTDFGLAHVATDVSLTQTGDLLGTMRYMSPEQAMGQRAIVDQRTDVYSLGATLYELLTHHAAFEATARANLLHAILYDDPRPPRAWNRAIPVELETIVLKCLAKSPSERYSSAGELAADLRRFLSERPILARRPTIVDSARKWLRRHPSFVAAGLLLMTGSLVALGITTAIVTHEQYETKQALGRESQRAREAEARLELAKRAADDMIRIAQEELTDAPFQDSPRQQLLETALRYYKEFVALRAGTPDDQAELSATRDNVQSILSDLSAMQAARYNILLSEPGVLDDIQATPAQRERIASLMASADAELQAVLGRIDKPSRQIGNTLLVRQEWRDVARRYSSELNRVITPAQVNRLRQIALQWQGPRVMKEYEVAAVLKLTSHQRDQIREIEHRMILCVDDDHPPLPPEMSEGFDDRDRFGPPARGFGGLAGSRPIPGVEERKYGFVLPDLQVLKAALDEVVKILTPEQRQAWDKMVGRPYEGTISIAAPGLMLSPDVPGFREFSGPRKLD